MALVERIQAAVARTETLPFRVEIATEAQMDGVIQLRAASYGKHLPELGAKLREAEAADFELGCEVLVATSKLDGSVLGTLRTHANVVAPLPLEASMTLPEKFDDTLMVETTRLCIKGSSQGSLVRSALFKALHQYCMEQGVNWMLAAGRKPVDKIYDWLLFSDVTEKSMFFPMQHAGMVPHRVMYFSPQEANALWLTHQHPLHSFVFETVHPDIDLSKARPLAITPEYSTLFTPAIEPVAAAFNRAQ
ncbi:N-acyl amino acid synthase FeeM domain-containing protein [Rhodoferax mekongensis]|uniref:N-acyl amino acid synthase FeeM catalytic core domain-containing protein n=1 Tax=Rhodoferax mekongensis TaxID=3068341 RepID=A0ABZ0AXE9_9BURK|nr:hypothetical protein [Rhodoferax sp. TBRC 17307]WNO04286.1 hypothetical protein RAN89_15465 [Rhodoferax sp. TBRC 17307]